MMGGLIALTPMARTSPWSIAIDEATRHALMLDPAFNGDNDTAQPLAGWRMQADVLPWIAAQENVVATTGFDANDWIAQTWAYDRHNVGNTPVEGGPVFGGDPIRALQSVKAKALLMSGELDRMPGTPTCSPAAPKRQPRAAAALHTVWSGANDLLGLLQDPNFAALTAAGTVATDIAASVANEVATVANLAAGGARSVLVLDVPDLGKVPALTEQGAAVASVASTLAASFERSSPPPWEARISAARTWR